MNAFPHKPLNPFIQLDWHGGIFLTGPFPIPGSAFHFSAGVLWLAKLGGDNKNNGETVLANGRPVLSQHHTVKYVVVPHWNVYPFFPVQPNLLIPLLILGSQNKCQFCSLTVQGPDGPIALSIFKYVGINQACNSPVPLPTSLTFNWGTVEIGFTLADFINGILNMAFDALISFIIGKTAGALANRLPRGLLKSQTMSLLGRLGLPKVMRGEGGRFASMSEALVGEAFKSLFGEVAGRGLGATPVGGTATSAIASFSTGLADAIN